MSYYVVCKAVTSFREIEEIEENPQTEIRRLQQAVLEDADVQGIPTSKSGL